jgi:hypothetical protein
MSRLAFNRRLIAQFIVLLILFFIEDISLAESFSLSRISKKDQILLRAELKKVITRDNLFSEMSNATIEFVFLGYLGVWKDHPLVVPTIIKFHGIENSYCRAVLWKSGGVNLVNIPEKFNPDHCQKISSVAYSNRYTAIIKIYQVYVSRSDGSYCYAEKASDALNPDWDGSADSAIRVLEKESNRTGSDVTNCSK